MQAKAMTADDASLKEIVAGRALTVLRRDRGEVRDQPERAMGANLNGSSPWVQECETLIIEAILSAGR
jgi:hypothetical protein